MLASGTGSIASSAALTSSASSVNVPAGPRKPTRARALDDISARLLGGALASRRSGGCGQCHAHGLRLLGRQLEFPAPGGDLLGVYARLIAVVDARCLLYTSPSPR